MELFVNIIALSICTVFILKIIVLLFLSFIVSINERHHVKRKRITEINSENIGNCESKLKRRIIYIYLDIYRYLVVYVSNIRFHFIRIFFYKHIFKMSIGKSVTIHRGLIIQAGYNIKIGTGTVIGDNNLLDGRAGLEIGKYVNFSTNASVYTMQHDPNDLYFGVKFGKAIIEDRAWISSNSVALPNVIVECGSVLAYGGIAAKKMDRLSIYAGIPEKNEKRNSNIKYENLKTPPVLY